jgi:hypothetical protein
MDAKHPRPRTDPGPRPGTDTGRNPRGTTKATGSVPRSGPGPRPGLRDRPTPTQNRTNRSVVAAARRCALAALTWALRVAVTAGRRVLAAVTGELGRRLGRAIGLTVVLAVVVTALYDRGEVPTAAARQAVPAPADRNQGGTAVDGGATTRRKRPAEPGGLRGRDRMARVGERPAAVAAAWYATHHGVPRAKVKPLQQDRLSATEVRVLVLADHGHGRLRTALVRLRHGANGWRVR